MALSRICSSNAGASGVGPGSLPMLYLIAISHTLAR